MTDPRAAAPDWLVAACAHPNFPGGGEGRTIANILWPSIEAEIARLRDTIREQESEIAWRDESLAFLRSEVARLRRIEEAARGTVGAWDDKWIGCAEMAPAITALRAALEEKP